MSNRSRPFAHLRRTATRGTTSVAAFASVALISATSAATAPPTSEPVTSEAGDEPLETVLPLAPDTERVDLEPPTFSNPTTIDNPLFPVSALRSVVSLGNDEGVPVKVETSVLPEPIVIDVNGQPVEAVGLLIVEYQHGRILDVSVKWYAQADDGSVWSLAEDVFAYEDGVLADTDGSWVASPDRPVAMAMPSDPHGGEVFRPENKPDSIEEYTVSDVGITIAGPTGLVEGAIVVQENHATDGVYEDKWFAPGYGEFSTGVGDSFEGVAIAAPADATPGPAPAELTTLSDGAVAVVGAAASGDWATVAEQHESMRAAWDGYEAAHDVPPLLIDQMNRALRALAGDGLIPAADDHNAEGTTNAALDVAQASLDLQLQFRPPEHIERERFVLWARQLVVDANRIEQNPAFVAGDVAALEWVLRRFAHTLGADVVTDIEAVLADLRVAVDDEEVEAAAELAPQLVDALIAAT